LLKYIKNNGPFPEVKAMGLIKDIIEGYKNIEENNIIHRDLKTSNIFLSKGKAKIADFGFC
jgi:serine/threonine-protein kinase ULK/ATG1